MGLRNFFSNLFKKRVKEPEPELSLEPDNVGGKIVIEYCLETEQFFVSADFMDTTTHSAELMSQLLVQLELGMLTNYVYSAIGAWAEDDDVKLAFNESVFLRLELLLGVMENAKKQLAVDPANVFSVKSAREQ